MGLENPVHIALLLLVVLLVFGAKRLPEMGRSLGSGLRGFRDSLNGHITAVELNPVGDEPVADTPAQPAADRAPAAPRG